MAYQLNHESDGRGVVIAFSGMVKGDEIYDLYEQFMADPLFVRWRYQIWDFSDAGEFDVTTDQLRKLAMQDARAARINPNLKIAIIRRRTGPPTGLDRIFHVFEDVWGAYASETFSDIDAARKWADPGYCKS
jgi:phytoene dehydrogenase-like protein